MNFKDFMMNEDFAPPGGMGMPPAPGGDMGAPAMMPPAGGMGGPGMGMGDPMGGMGGGMQPPAMGGDMSQVPLKVRDADVWSVLDGILSGKQVGQNTKNVVEPAGQSKLMA